MRLPASSAAVWRAATASSSTTTAAATSMARRRCVALASSSSFSSSSSSSTSSALAARGDAARLSAPRFARGLATSSRLSRAAFGSPALNNSLFAPLDTFSPRHIGPRDAEVKHMLSTLGYSSMEEFLSDAVPAPIRLSEKTTEEGREQIRPLSESEIGRRGRELAAQNVKAKSLIGMGYHNTNVPPVILRNVLENPAWYTSYTPYQPEISQGRLESLINYQTMVKSLTGLDIANASLLDEGTAAAEAMILAYGQTRSKRKTFLVDTGILPQTLAVLRQRAKGFGIKVVQTDLSKGLAGSGEDAKDVMGVLVQYPDVDGRICDWEALAKEVKANGGLTIAATDLLALTMIKPPGEWGADVALGNAARFGVPPGYGGPHAAFFAVTDALKRKIPGRLIGLSRDARGKPAYRLALQTREQHIRREKATSNICTAQALLANMSAMYAVYHGPEGLRKIAAKVHGLTRLLKHALLNIGLEPINEDGAFFDTLTIPLPKTLPAEEVHSRALQAGLNLRRIADDRVGISLDETVTIEDLSSVLNVFAAALKGDAGIVGPFDPATLIRFAGNIGLNAKSLDKLEISTPSAKEGVAKSSVDFSRKSDFLTQPVFSAHRSETQLLRYIHHLQSKDLSLVHAMIPLGSCTMKLNSTSSMQFLSDPGYHGIHPLAPVEQAQGYQTLIRELEDDLAKLTGFPAVSLQPNSGAQGEFAGLSVIRAYLDSRGEGKRDVCLIPNSAHGTNPASAIMAGMRVVAVKNKADGILDLDDLRAKAEKHKDELAALMVTYPSTYGVFEESIKEACDIIHQNGGQVYMDGANMQAQVGLTNPGIIGADVTHLNLHKTFSIPHGGGGPGVGPIGVAAHLAPFLPGHPLAKTGGDQAIDPISAAPWGSASILTISWSYIKMLGWDGLRESSAVSLLSANYMAHRLAPHYKLRYTNDKKRVAHEFLLDLAEFGEHNIVVTDVAKRLSDYGFHAPTCSWPINTGLLIEPTESESLAEVDRFCDAMIAIRKEIASIAAGEQGDDKKDNVLKNAPHTAESLTDSSWESRKYSREQAVYPVAGLRSNKFWPAASRLDDAHGDLNLICECGSVDQYAEAE